MKKWLFLFIILILSSCADTSRKNNNDNDMVKLITVDPGHFHAALVQKTMYEGVSPDVYVFAPESADLKQHLDRIQTYNSRAEDPTSWNEIVYSGDDFFDAMLRSKSGNVVVLSGNNRKKAEYITRSVEAGYNVLADKPMIISPDDFPTLENAFAKASENGVLLYDIMTERFEVTTILQKLLSLNKDVFGSLQEGTEHEPAITKISVHHFSKMVSGAPLMRPAWFFDTEQQGEGIVDVTTHLVDLIQWECFPEQILKPSDIAMVSARRWPTLISQEQFREVTGYESFPDYLQKDVKNGTLNVFSNGEMVYRIRNIYARVSVEWNFMPPVGGGDTHYSSMHGTECDLVIKQGPDEKFIPVLYIENIRDKTPEFTRKLMAALDSLPYDSLSFENTGNSLRINIPSKYRVTHEEHFSQVMQQYLEFLRSGRMPEWEIPGMITKYYTTTSALRKAMTE